MGVEIEAKMRAKDLDKLRAKLRDVGATFVSRTLETNRFFDTPDNHLRSDDRGLRLRTNTDRDTGRAEHVVTMKGPRQGGKHKRREELEFAVTDVEAAGKVFDHLGYGLRLEFEKRRESWKLDDCKIELDELPTLGTFIEVEGPDEDSVDAAREKLGLQEEPSVTTSYASMVGDLLEKQGSQRLRFTKEG